MESTVPTPSIPTVACEHKVRIGCALTALSVCCACADTRPEAPAYPVYIDGEGMKMRGKRWTRYCWKCRDHWNLDSTGLTDLQIPNSDSTSAPQSQSTASDQFTGEPSQPTMPQFNPQAPPWPIAQRTNAHLSRFPPQLHPHTMPHQHPPVFPLGTREDVEQEDYQSPVGLMFQRAYERYRTAEEIRQEVMANLRVPPGLIQTYNPTLQHAAFSQPEQFARIQQGYIPVGPPLYAGTRIQLGYPANSMPAMENYRQGQGQAQGQAQGPAQSQARPHVVAPVVEAGDGDDIDTNAVDRQPTRPEPLSAESMMVDIACKMCLEQKIDTLIEPCMHVALCRWCSFLWMMNARNLRQRNPNIYQPWKCPVCRKGIQRVRRVYI